MKQQIDKDTLMDLVMDVGEWEKEHRKGTTFYSSHSLDITEDLVEEFPELQVLLGYNVTASGYWSDYDGCDYGNNIEFYKITKYIEHHEEVIVKPAWKEPVWESVESPVELV